MPHDTEISRLRALLVRAQAVMDAAAPDGGGYGEDPDLADDIEAVLGDQEIAALVRRPSPLRNLADLAERYTVTDDERHKLLGLLVEVALAAS